MRIPSWSVLALGLVACGGGADNPPAADTTAAAPAAPAAISLADLAGTWVVTAKAEGTDSVLVTSELMATADTSGWMQHLPGRDPIQMRVVLVDADSVVTETGPYESVLRPGVQVTTRGVMRLQDGRLVGTTVATYSGGEGENVVRLTTEGTRKP
jgi:hypothetical protein